MTNEITISDAVVLEKDVVKFGTGGHLVVPKEFIGKKVKIIFEDKE
jgi:putative transposon-encoded protein